MNRLIGALLAVTFTFSIMSLSCNKDDDNIVVTPTPSAVTSTITQGAWRVTVYTDKGVNQLSWFSDYSFTFSNGTVKAVKTGSTVTGTYAAGNDDSKVKFILNFGSVSLFNELNEDWLVLEQTVTKLRLQHVSGGNGGTSVLTFEKL